MQNRKFSAYLSFALCVGSAALLAVWLFTFPAFFHWLYFSYHHLDPNAQPAIDSVRTVVRCFYCCAPFAGAALAMLIGLLWNILHERVFIARNVFFLRWVAWCCWAVCAVAFGFGFSYLPLMIVAFATGVVGTLLRVVKSVMHAAVALQEENSLTV